MIDRTKGQTLYFSQWGGERPIPDVFIAAMERAEERTSGYAVDQGIPDAVKNDPDVVEAFFDSRERRTNEKVLVVIRKKDGVIGPLRDIRTTDNGQTVQVEATMFRTVDTNFTIAKPTEIQDVSVKDLGNGWSIQEVGISGTYISGVFTPGIFQGVELSTRREDPVPNEFRTGLPVSEVQSIVAGTVAQPTLGANDLEARERQIAQHKKLLSRLTRDGLTLPFSLINKRTNDKKQLVLVTDTYRLVSTTPPISTTEDVKVLDLGDGHEVLTTEIIPTLFDQTTYEKQIADVVPERFRADLPTSKTRQIVAGTAVMPSLSAGDLLKSEEQVTTLTKLTEILTRANVTLPAVIIDSATITEYGGGKVTITATLDTATLTVDEGEGVVNSKVTNLGNGYMLKESIARVAGAWPIRNEAHFDARLQIIIPATKQVVAKGSTTSGISSGIITEIQPIDGYREDRIITTQPLSAVDSYVRVLYGNNTNVYVPPHLESLNGYIDLGGGAGAYSENGSYSLSGSNGNGSVQLRGSAQASAVAIPELGWVVKIPRTNNIPCIHVVLYVASGVDRATIVSAVSTVLGGGVTDWPNFRPQPITVKGVGGKVNIRTDVTVSAHDSVVTDYLGAPKINASSRSSGSGVSYDVGVTTKIFNIPETIHGNLSITGNSSLSTPNYGAQGTINSGNAGSISTLVYANTSGSLGIISATGVTTGDFVIPSSGKRVHRLYSEPDPVYPRLRVLAEVVEFTDITP